MRHLKIEMIEVLLSHHFETIQIGVLLLSPWLGDQLSRYSWPQWASKEEVKKIKANMSSFLGYS